MNQKLFYLAFFCSGFAGLGYQVLWSKYLQDWIGVSAYAYALVLAVFMGGLALGSAIFGPLSDKSERPLKIFIGLEILLCIYSMLVFLPFQDWLHSTLPSTLASSMQGRLIICLILLLPPTVLMGGTYPSMLKTIKGVLQKETSLLYAINASGAALGTLALGFWILPLLGKSSSLYLLSLFNLLAASLAFVTVFLPPTEENDVQKTDSIESIKLPENLIFFTAFLCGLLTFALETVWARFFALTLSSSTYSFSIVVFVFLCGIALSSFILAFRPRIENPGLIFARCLIFCGVYILLTLPLYIKFPWLFKVFSMLLSSEEPNFSIHQAGKFLLCTALIFIPASLSGISIPILVQALRPEFQNLGLNVGKVYSVNSLGNVLGALICGFFLLPLGLWNLLIAFGLIFVLLGLGLLYHLKKQSLPLNSLALIACLTAIAFPWDPLWLTFGTHRREPVAEIIQNPASLLASRKVVLHKEDPAGSVMVVEQKNPDGKIVRQLFINGKVDATNDTDTPSQILTGALPALLHPDLKSALVIGLASGASAGAILQFPVESVEIIELIGSMPQATEWFEDINFKPLQDRRSRLIVEDARNYLMHTTKTFDVIVSEPSNPWMVGVASLFNQEFYLRAAKQLNPKGLFLQWVQFYELSDATVSMIISTIKSVFPHLTIFQGSATDLLILASKEPLTLDLPALESRFKQSKPLFSSIEIHSLPALFALQRFSSGMTDLLASYGSKWNTEDNLALEYMAPVDLFYKRQPLQIQSLDERLIASPFLWNYGSVEEASHKIKALDLKWMRNPEIIEPMIEAHFLAMRDYNLEFPDLSQIQLLSRLGQPPSSVSTFFSLLQYNLKQALPVETLLAASQFRLCWLCALSEKASQEILNALKPLKQKDLNIGMVYINCLLASKNLVEARQELIDLLGSSTPPASWAIFTACQLDQGKLCEDILIHYAKDPESGSMARNFYALRKHAGKILNSR